MSNDPLAITRITAALSEAIHAKADDRASVVGHLDMRSTAFEDLASWMAREGEPRALIAAALAAVEPDVNGVR